MGEGEVEQCENAQHPDNHGKWFARPDHFAKTFPFKETIIQFYFFCKIDQNNQQDFLKKLVVGGRVINHGEGGVEKWGEQDDREREASVIRRGGDVRKREVKQFRERGLSHGF